MDSSSQAGGGDPLLGSIHHHHHSSHNNSTSSHSHAHQNNHHHHHNNHRQGFSQGSSLTSSSLPGFVDTFSYGSAATATGTNSRTPDSLATAVSAGLEAVTANPMDLLVSVGGSNPNTLHQNSQISPPTSGNHQQHAQQQHPHGYQSFGQNSNNATANGMMYQQHHQHQHSQHQQNVYPTTGSVSSGNSRSSRGYTSRQQQQQQQHSHQTGGGYTQYGSPGYGGYPQQQHFQHQQQQMAMQVSGGTNHSQHHAAGVMSGYHHSQVPPSLQQQLPPTHQQDYGQNQQQQQQQQQQSSSYIRTQHLMMPNLQRSTTTISTSSAGSSMPPTTTSSLQTAGLHPSRIPPASPAAAAVLSPRNNTGSLKDGNSSSSIPSPATPSNVNNNNSFNPHSPNFNQHHYQQHQHHPQQQQHYPLKQNHHQTLQQSFSSSNNNPLSPSMSLASPLTPSSSVSIHNGGGSGVRSINGDLDSNASGSKPSTPLPTHMAGIGGGQVPHASGPRSLTSPLMVLAADNKSPESVHSTPPYGPARNHRGPQQQQQQLNQYQQPQTPTGRMSTQSEPINSTSAVTAGATAAAAPSTIPKNDSLVFGDDDVIMSNVEDLTGGNASGNRRVKLVVKVILERHLYVGETFDRILSTSVLSNNVISQDSLFSSSSISSITDSDHQPTDSVGNSNNTDKTNESLQRKNINNTTTNNTTTSTSPTTKSSTQSTSSTSLTSSVSIPSTTVTETENSSTTPHNTTAEKSTQEENSLMKLKKETTADQDGQDDQPTTEQKDQVKPEKSLTPTESSDETKEPAPAQQEPENPATGTAPSSLLSSPVLPQLSSGEEMVKADDLLVTTTACQIMTANSSTTDQKRQILQEPLTPVATPPESSGCAVPQSEKAVDEKSVAEEVIEEELVEEEIPGDSSAGAENIQHQVECQPTFMDVEESPTKMPTASTRLLFSHHRNSNHSGDLESEKEEEAVSVLLSLSGKLASRTADEAADDNDDSDKAPPGGSSSEDFHHHHPGKSMSILETPPTTNNTTTDSPGQPDTPPAQVQTIPTTSLPLPENTAATATGHSAIPPTVPNIQIVKEEDEDEVSREANLHPAVDTDGGETTTEEVDEPEQLDPAVLRPGTQVFVKWRENKMFYAGKLKRKISDSRQSEKWEVIFDADEVMRTFFEAEIIRMGRVERGQKCKFFINPEDSDAVMDATVISSCIRAGGYHFTLEYTDMKTFHRISRPAQDVFLTAEQAASYIKKETRAPRAGAWFADGLDLTNIQYGSRSARSSRTAPTTTTGSSSGKHHAQQHHAENESESSSTLKASPSLGRKARGSNKRALSVEYDYYHDSSSVDGSESIPAAAGSGGGKQIKSARGSKSSAGYSPLYSPMSSASGGGKGTGGKQQPPTPMQMDMDSIAGSVAPSEAESRDSADVSITPQAKSPLNNVIHHVVASADHSAHQTPERDLQPQPQQPTAAAAPASHQQQSPTSAITKMPPLPSGIFARIAFLIHNNNHQQRFSNNHSNVNSSANGGSSADDQDSYLASGAGGVGSPSSIPGGSRSSITYDPALLRSKILTAGGVVFDDVLTARDAVLAEQLQLGCAQRQIVLISDTYHRTRMYLHCLASGIPCIRYEWVIHCCGRSAYQDYKSHLLPSGYSAKKNNVSAICQQKLKGNILRDVKACVISENATQLIDHWREILSSAGVDLLPSLPSSLNPTRKNAGDKFLALVDKEPTAIVDEELIDRAKSLKIPIVGMDYIEECLVNGRRIPPEEFRRFHNPIGSSSTAPGAAANATTSVTSSTNSPATNSTTTTTPTTAVG